MRICTRLLCGTAYLADARLPACDLLVRLRDVSKRASRGDGPRVIVAGRQLVRRQLLLIARYGAQFHDCFANVIEPAGGVKRLYDDLQSKTDKAERARQINRVLL